MKELISTLSKPWAGGRELSDEFEGAVRQAFGRFPHRNKVLGRENTEAEDAYLAGEAASFGQ